MASRGGEVSRKLGEEGSNGSTSTLLTEVEDSRDSSDQ